MKRGDKVKVLNTIGGNINEGTIIDVYDFGYKVRVKSKRFSITVMFEKNSLHGFDNGRYMQIVGILK